MGSQWCRLQPFRPIHERSCPSNDHRVVLNGILWLLSAGAPWRDLSIRWKPGKLWQSVLPAMSGWCPEPDYDLPAGTERWTTTPGQGLSFSRLNGCPCPSVRCQGRDGARETAVTGRSRADLNIKVQLRDDRRWGPMMLRMAWGQKHESGVLVSMIA